MKRTEPQGAVRGFHCGDRKHYRVLELEAVQSGRNVETSEGNVLPPFLLMKIHRRFGGIPCLHFRGDVLEESTRN